MPEINEKDPEIEFEDQIYYGNKNFRFPSKKQALKDFFIESFKSLKFIFSSKGCFIFYILQVLGAIIGFGIFIGFTPGTFVELLDKNRAIFCICFMWVIFCIFLTIYLINIPVFAIGISYIWYNLKGKITISDCFQILYKEIGRLSIMAMKDLWRLDEICVHTFDLKKAFNGFDPHRYDVRQIAEVGLTLFSIYGLSKEESYKNTFTLLKQKFKYLASLHIAYNLIRTTMIFIISLILILGLGYIYINVDDFASSKIIYNLFTTPKAGLFIILISIFSALSFVTIIFKPLYMISIIRVYISYAIEQGIEPRFRTIL